MEVAGKFIEQYSKERDYYERAAKLCAEICENEFERSGIRAIVTFRAKRPDKLKEKVIKRSEKKDYKDIVDIYNDIVDLAGVRIALYFPGDLETIDKFIKTNFNIKSIRQFPEVGSETYSKKEYMRYKKVFSGYHATHYRVTLKPENCADEDVKYCDATIEIQVASVLMHAWAEVEHDLVYKPSSGEISLDEYEILDELNGLILSGEMALRRLQKAVKERVTRQEEAFSNHYELAAFLYDKVSAKTNNTDEIIMGRADMLFKFLKYSNLNKPQTLNKYINEIEFHLEKDTVVDEIIDKILENDISLFKVFLKAKSEMTTRNPYSDTMEETLGCENKKALGYFIDNWLAFQSVIRSYIKKFHPEIGDNVLITPKLLMNLFNDENIVNRAKIIQNLRIEIVHGLKLPDEKHITEAIKAIEDIMGILYSKFSKEEIEELRNKFKEICLNL